MGETPGFSLNSGEAAAIPTGGELPENADAVVMVEYTDLYQDGFVYINKAAAPGNNVVFKGDDTGKGSVVVRAGTRIRPQEAGMLAAAGHPEVQVIKRLKVGIISTGDEVVEAGASVTGAQVRNVNTPMLYAGVLEYGAKAVDYGIVKDDYDRIRAAAAKALDECDIVLISGGSSVGERDETGKVINSLGTPGVLVHGIAVKPGKPTIIGNVKGKAVFGLPGHPASAYMIYKVFVVYLMDLMYGKKITREQNEIFPEYRTAEMAVNYPSNNGREEFVPVCLELDAGNIVARPVFGKSGLVSMLSRADGYVRIQRSSEGLQKGQLVKVFRF
jgi:molybdopterin molybdotransferase